MDEHPKDRWDGMPAFPGGRGTGRHEASNRSMKGEGSNFKERQQERVLCPECGKELVKGSLVKHRQTQHGVAKWGLVS